MRYKPEVSRLSGMQLLTLTIAVLFLSHSVYGWGGSPKNNAIGQFGITWTFDKNLTTDGAGDTYQHGTFINGDYWVLGPVTIVGIDPPSTAIDGHIKNGSMINPVSEDQQSYDSFGRGYRADKNVALNVNAQNPLIVMAGSSLISSISINTDTALRPQLNTAVVLTVLAVVPPTNSFRPPYSGSDKSIRATESDIDRTKLSNLAKPDGALSYSALVTRIKMNHGPWLDHYGGYLSRYVAPALNMPDYGRDIAQRTGEAALALNLDYTPAEKEPILIDFLQLGIDLYGIVEAGDIYNWLNNGGHKLGRKLPILFAANVFNDAGMKAMFEKTGDYISEAVDADGYPDPTGPGKPPADYIYFQEDDQTHYITQYDYDLTNNLVPGTPWNPDSRIEQFPYLKEHIGLPEWGIRHATQPERNASQLGTNYRSLNAVTYPAMALAVHIMGMKEHWNHNALFDYTDRWMEWIGGTKGIPLWVRNAWFDYRNDYPPIWPNQSGNLRPTANISVDPDGVITDADGNGVEQVSLDGSASTDNDGDIVSWVWTDNLGDPIPDGEKVTATLRIGEHIITLTVTDDNGASDTDTVAISIVNSGEPTDPDEDLVYSSTLASTSNGVDSFVQIPTSGMSAGGGTIGLSTYAEDLSVSRYLFGHTVGSWSNRIQLYIRDGNLGLGLGDTNLRRTNIAPIQPKRWYHVALTWNGSSYAVYVDGSESATGSYSGLTQLNDFADIGNTGNPTWRDQEAFSGVIDDVFIYNRALNANEILALHKAASKRAKYELKDFSGLEAKDSTNNNAPANLVNGPLWTGAGELKLDGIDDYVDCGSGASVNLTGDLTVTAWICPDSFGGNGLGRIVDKGDVNSGFAFYVRGDTRSIAYLTYGDDFVDSNSVVIDLAQWQHVAVTYSDASHTVAFYVNGEPAGGGNYQTNPNDSANAPLIIGNRAASDRGFEGMLSDVRIYSRALAADEISAIYRTYEVRERGDPWNKYLSFEVSATDSDGTVLNYVAQNPLALPAGATFTNSIFTWLPWYNQAGSYEITFEVPGQPDYTQSVPMVVENVTPAPYYRYWLESLNKY